MNFTIQFVMEKTCIVQWSRSSAGKFKNCSQSRKAKNLRRHEQFYYALRIFPHPPAEEIVISVDRGSEC